jgi:transposase-like protein
MKRVCPYCNVSSKTSDASPVIVCNGHFKRKSDGQKIQKYFCKSCSRNFSSATTHACVNQNKRHLNTRIRNLYASGMTIRGTARYFSVSRTTVVRKLIFIGTQIDMKLDSRNKLYPPARVVEFDDVITFEHTKLKPISIIIAVVSGERRILGVQVASMPSFGKLKEKSIQKYGKREDSRKQAREALFERIKPHVDPKAIIKSDESPHYPKDVKKHFPLAVHQTFKGRRGCVVGQGELKAIGFDPLFSLNHSAAMLRANMSRLMRRTWNTTKKMERLWLHLLIYLDFHNRRIAEIQKKKLKAA